MSEIKAVVYTGGPAYPVSGTLERGVTMRDYFAAKAMQHMSLPTKVYNGRIGDNSWRVEEMHSFPFEDMAKIAYLWADAMLKAREVGHG